MKILHIINSLGPGGAEKLLLNSIPLYNRKGLKVDLLLLKNYNSIFLQELKSLNICTIYNLNQRSLYNPLIIFRLYKFFKSYDILHVHLFPALYWSAVAGYLFGRNKIMIYTEHSTHNKRRDLKYLKLLETIIYKRYNKIICIGNDVKINLQKWLYHTHDTMYSVIHNGINLDNFLYAEAFSREILNIPLDAKVLLMVAKFYIPKDHKTVIEAFANLQNKNVYLIFVGDGVLKKESMDLVKDLHLEDKVLFLGIRNDIPGLVKMSDICLLSSKWEGFGLVAVEYMAGGKPVVASNVPGLKQIVENAGLLFEQGNAIDLKDKIKCLLDDNTIYQDISAKCKERSFQFGIDKMVDSYIDIYYKTMDFVIKKS